jgi:hypothetical protein
MGTRQLSSERGRAKAKDFNEDSARLYEGVMGIRNHEMSGAGAVV